MTTSTSNKTPIVSALLALRGKGAPDGTSTLRDAILRSGSATPGNTQASNALEFGSSVLPEVGERLGAKLVDTPYLVSEIVYAVENMKLPAEVSAELPELSAEAWAAAMRFVTLVVLELEARPEEPGSE